MSVEKLREAAKIIQECITEYEKEDKEPAGEEKVSKKTSDADDEAPSRPRFG